MPFRLIPFAILIFLVISRTNAQDPISYETFQGYHQDQISKIKELQEKEDKTVVDRYRIIRHFEQSNRTYEQWLQQNPPFKEELTGILMDNYTYCMRKYPDRSDSARIQGYLDKALQLGLCDYRYAWYVGELLGSDVEELLWKDPCLRGLIGRIRVEQDFWSDARFGTPYDPQISEQEKVAGLSKLWSEAKYNFAYFDQVPYLDWDSLYLAFIPKVLATENTPAYYDSLQVFCASLKDSHTQVYLPGEAERGRPPIRSQYVDGRVFISDVYNQGLLDDGLKPGMEVMAINGLDVHDYAEQNIRPFICASTSQDALIRTYEHQLFYGDRDEELLIVFKNHRGRLKKVELNRSLPYDNYSQRKPLEFEVLPGNIGYLAISSFSSKNQLTRDFDQVFGQLDSTTSLIIDVRHNGGGNSGKASYIFSCFIDTLSLKWKSETREYLPTERAWTGVSSWHPYEVGKVRPHPSQHYDKPVVILTGPRTISAAEDFCLLFDWNDRATLMGEATAGSTGQPLQFNLPGGGRARVCTLRSSYPDGKEFVGTGIVPDIVVAQTVDAFLQDLDPALQKAQEFLSRENQEL